MKLGEMPFYRSAGARRIAAIVAAGALALALSGPAAAEKWRPGDSDYPQITVQSDIYASETISAPVRRTPHGDEVRLPGGAWVRCSFNCYHTLRNSTIDFWRRYGAQ